MSIVNSNLLLFSFKVFFILKSLHILRLLQSLLIFWYLQIYFTATTTTST